MAGGLKTQVHFKLVLQIVVTNETWLYTSVVTNDKFHCKYFASWGSLELQFTVKSATYGK